MIPIDDDHAIHILKVIADGRLKNPSDELLLFDLDVQAALAKAFGKSSQSETSRGELARSALDLLTEDPAFAEPIHLMAMQPISVATRHRYLDVSTIAITTAVLLVLQTRIKFKLDDNGKWSVEIHKKAASDAILKLVVQRLLATVDK
jgi:hypothetical protein